MSTAQIKKRLDEIESELAELRTRLDGGTRPSKNGCRSIIGSFANDPLHAEAMRLGRKWRESENRRTKPKSKARTKRRR